MMVTTHHAACQAQDRFGIALDDYDTQRILWRIRAGRGWMVAQQADGRQVWAVQLRARVVRVVVDAAHTTVVTVMPGPEHCVTREPPMPRGQRRARWRGWAGA